MMEAEGVKTFINETYSEVIVKFVLNVLYFSLASWKISSVIYRKYRKYQREVCRGGIVHVMRLMLSWVRLCLARCSYF